MTKRETSQFIIIIFQYIVILLLLTKYITQSRKKTVTTTIGNYASASLTNHNQLKTLGCTYTENGNCYGCNNSPYTFVKWEENSWWTGSSINHIRIWYHDQTGACSWNYYYSTQGLRPTVTISKNEINFN